MQFKFRFKLKHKLIPHTDTDKIRQTRVAAHEVKVRAKAPFLPLINYATPLTE